ncbi:phospholipase carboxylesterase [Lichtheimia corymbifera JMRC:FSU:9682]|uniref:Acyl-protein thioesterase 1 n=1 Tax=Lichtheimia corymbifera JMRC:FSU:9682 TaxID=1263082 RepID=A0A068SDV9_9FUNG|nr:phospholipase carboxylesterase [Lichtheimia corymbifera JMRC:FSU:9682]
MAQPLRTVVVNPTAKHTATVIFLHGLGDSGVGWLFLTETIAPMLPHVKWVLPDAPMRPLEANDNLPTPAWFNIPSFLKSANVAKVDEQGMIDSVNAVNDLIEKEVRDTGIPSDRIVLGGFSQGCVIALLTGFLSKHKLAGVIGCSGWIGVLSIMEKSASDVNKGTPFLLCHGEEDLVVKPKYGQASAKYLNKVGHNATFKLYPGLGHAAGPKEIADIAAFLKEQLPPQPVKSKL